MAPKLSLEARTTIVELLRCGWSRMAIAESLGVTEGSVRYRHQSGNLRGSWANVGPVTGKNREESATPGNTRHRSQVSETTATWCCGALGGATGISACARL
jgi:hypothetical protein